MAKRRRGPGNRQWYVVDLHLHTPASGDYQEKGVEYLDILKRCKEQNLNIIAFTDHNTVAGYKAMMDQIEQLELLEKLDRTTPEERTKLNEFRELRKEILVLPGFEFTATFGFHLLGIFPPEKSLRDIEHILLNLNISTEELDTGSQTVGASSDVLTAYKAIKDNGGMALAAHANSSNGVAMRGFKFGGQTKIAYTQDPNLDALEVTDLGKRGRYATSAFFNGTKPEYPRRMHCIQGSDAHRLTGQGGNTKNLGVGERTTEVHIPEPSFESLQSLFDSNDFARTRPHSLAKESSTERDVDFVQHAIEEGPSIVQDFHERMTVRGGSLYSVIADVCAFANTNGGTVYVGLSADSKKAPAGIPNVKSAVDKMQKEISSRISPPLSVDVNSQKTRGKNIIRILVPRGDDPPYAVEDSKIYVRDETETGLAVRDEIVQLVTRQSSLSPQEPVQDSPSAKDDSLAPPRTGVEVVTMEERNGTEYFTLRDLRNGNVVKNVTRKSARRLWHYAILEYEELPKNNRAAGVKWEGDLGVVKESRRGKGVRYDLAQKSGVNIRFYYGVTEDGIHGAWKELIDQNGNA